MRKAAILDFRLLCRKLTWYLWRLYGFWFKGIQRPFSEKFSFLHFFSRFNLMLLAYMDMRVMTHSGSRAELSPELLTPDSWLIYINIYVYTCVYVYVCKSWENQSTYWTNLDCLYNCHFTLVHILVYRVENHFWDSGKDKFTSCVVMLRKYYISFCLCMIFEKMRAVFSVSTQKSMPEPLMRGTWSGLFEKLQKPNIQGDLKA